MNSTILILTIILALAVLMFVFLFVFRLNTETEKYISIKKYSKKPIKERASSFSKSLSSKQLNSLINVLKK